MAPQTGFRSDVSNIWEGDAFVNVGLLGETVGINFSFFFVLLNSRVISVTTILRACYCWDFCVRGTDKVER